MKTGIVISLRKVVRKLLLILLCCTTVSGIIYWKIPQKMCVTLAGQMLKKASGMDAPVWSASVFSFQFPKTVYAAMPGEPVEKLVTTAVPVATPAPQPVIPVQPAPDASDLSGQNPAKASVNHGIIVKNHAGKDFQLEDLLQKSLPYSYSPDEYTVLIVHTHTSESYFPNDRSENDNENMIRVGKEFTSVLEKNGIKALHITKVHDVPYTTSYKKSLESVSAALKEHPSIQVVIDLHRDALYSETNEKIRPVTTIDGTEAAQVMIVTGTEKGGLPHPNWSENLAFSLKLQNDMLKNYPNLARPVDLRKERFNTHTTKNSIILEIGTNGNTMEEALRGAGFAAQSLANVLLKK